MGVMQVRSALECALWAQIPQRDQNRRKGDGETRQSARDDVGKAQNLITNYRFRGAKLSRRTLGRVNFITILVYISEYPAQDI